MIEPHPISDLHKVLLVHGDDKLCALYRQRLSSQFRIDSAHNGLSGIRKVRSFAPHLVVSECNLPLLSGFGVLKFIRNHPMHAHIPVILIGEKGYEDQALNFGATDWLNLDHEDIDDLIKKIYMQLKQKTYV